MPTDDQLSALERLTKLRDSGALNEEEFASQKASILNSSLVTAPNVPFYRRLWLVVTLTCLIFTFWVALLILITGQVYKRAKDRSLIPIKKATRFIYAGLLALWLCALIIRAIADPDAIKNAWTQSADTSAPSSTSTQAASGGSSPPDMCDSSDAADMVKGAIEQSATSKLVDAKVLGFGHAHELLFDKKANARYCQADADLNTGTTALSYKLFYGLSGGELVEVQPGEDAFNVRAIVAVEAAQSELPTDSTSNSPQGPTTSSQQFSGGRYHRASPASADMSITRVGELWHIAIDGAGPPNGGNTPAECSLVAEGPLANEKINANLVPFHNDNIDITADDLSSNPGRIVVQLTPSGTTVLQASVEGYCGVGSDLTGSYSPAQ